MLRSAGMANDKDDIPTLTLEVLKDIRGDMRQMNHRLENVEHHLVTLNGRVETLSSKVDALTGRFDHFLEFGGETHRELDRRVAKLESHVFGSGAGAP